MKTSIVRSPRAAIRARRPSPRGAILAALVAALTLSACGQGGFDFRGWSLRAYAPETGAPDSGGPRLLLNREGEGIFGTWTLGGVFGLVEGRATAEGTLHLDLYGPGTAVSTGSFDGRYERGETLLAGRLSPAGGSPGPEIRLADDPAPWKGFRGQRLLATSRKGLGKDGEATRFAYLGFEPAGDAAFLAWYRETFQGGLGLPAAMEKERKAFISAFETDTVTRAENGAPVLPWYYEGRQCLVLSNPSLLVMGLRLATFEGGAHGAAAIRYAVIDRAKRRVLGIGDILVEGWRERIQPALERNARGALGLREGQSFVDAGFFENAIVPGKDFFLTPVGIGFDYDQYELAPYASGAFWFVVPFGDIGELLKPGVLGRFDLAPAPAAPAPGPGGAAP